MRSRRKSWADREGVPSGVWGEVYEGIPIIEENRATGWEYRRDGIEELLKIARENYRVKGVRAYVYGVDDGGVNVKYAIFVQSGFLRPVTEDE
jgi:hypothetical protein